MERLGTKKDRTKIPPVILKNLQSILLEARELEVPLNDCPPLTDLEPRYELCLHSAIQWIDGTDSKKAKMVLKMFDKESGDYNKDDPLSECIIMNEKRCNQMENEVMRSLAYCGTLNRFLEKTATIFSFYESRYVDEPIKDKFLKKGESLMSEVMFSTELRRMRRCTDIREEDKLYLIRGLEKFSTK